MKKRVSLTIEEELIKKIKALAAKKQCSVSQLAEDYFVFITKKKSIIDLIEELPKPNRVFPDDFDFKKEYYEANKKKYGF